MLIELIVPYLVYEMETPVGGGHWTKGMDTTRGTAFISSQWYIWAW